MKFKWIGLFKCLSVILSHSHYFLFSFSFTFLRLTLTDSCKLPPGQSRVDADGGELFAHAEGSGSHTVGVSNRGFMETRDHGHISPDFQPLYFLGDELEILSIFCGQTARGEAVSQCC